MHVVEFLFAVSACLLLWSSCCNGEAKKLCRDPECRDPISLARAVRAHRSADGRLLAFDATDVVTVYAKHQEPNQEIWEGQVNNNGQMGYFPRVMVEEFTVYEPNPQYTVAIRPGQKVTPQSVSEERDVKRDKPHVDGEHLQTQSADSNKLDTDESLTRLHVPDPVVQWRQQQSQQEETSKDVMEETGGEGEQQMVGSEDMNMASADQWEDGVTGQSVEDQTEKLRDFTTGKTAHEKQEELSIYEQLEIAHEQVQTLESKEKTDGKVQLPDIPEGVDIGKELAAARKRVSDLQERLQEEEAETEFDDDDENADPEVELNERDETKDNGYIDYIEHSSWEDEEEDDYEEDNQYEEDTATGRETYEGDFNDRREEMKTGAKVEYTDREESRDTRDEVDTTGRDDIMPVNEDDNVNEIADNLEASKKETKREDTDHSDSQLDQLDAATEKHEQDIEHKLKSLNEDTWGESEDDDKSDSDETQRQNTGSPHDGELDEIDKHTTTEDVENTVTDEIQHTETSTREGTLEETDLVAKHSEQQETVMKDEAATENIEERLQTDEPTSSETTQILEEKETQSEDNVIEEPVKDKPLVMEEYSSTRQDAQATDRVNENVETKQYGVASEQELDETVSREVTADDVSKATDGDEVDTREGTESKTESEVRDPDEARNGEDPRKHGSVIKEDMHTMDQADAMGVESGIDATNKDGREPINYGNIKTETHDERGEVHTTSETDAVTGVHEVEGDDGVSQEASNMGAESHLEHTETDTRKVDDPSASKLNGATGQIADSDVEKENDHDIASLPEQVKEKESSTSALFAANADLHTTSDEQSPKDVMNGMSDDTANPPSLTQTDMMKNEESLNDNILTAAAHSDDIKREDSEYVQQYGDVEHEETSEHEDSVEHGHHVEDGRQVEHESSVEHGQQAEHGHHVGHESEVKMPPSDEDQEQRAKQHPDVVNDRDYVKQLLASLPISKGQTTLSEEEEKQQTTDPLSGGGEMSRDVTHDGDREEVVGSEMQGKEKEDELSSESDKQVASEGDELSDDELVRIREEENRRHEEEKQKVKETNKVPEFTATEEKTVDGDQRKNLKDKPDEHAENENTKDEKEEQIEQSDVVDGRDVNTDDRQADQQTDQSVQNANNVSVNEQDKPYLTSEEFEPMDEFDEEFHERETRYMEQLDKVEDQREARYWNQLQEDKEDALRKTAAHLESAYARRFEDVKRKGAGNDEWMEKEIQRLEKEKEEAFARDERIRDEDIVREMNNSREERKKRRQVQLERFQAIERERIRIRREEKRQRDLEYEKELQRIEKERQQRNHDLDEEERLRREEELRLQEERAREKEERKREEREMRERQRLEEIARQWDKRISEERDATNKEASTASSTWDEEMGNERQTDAGSQAQKTEEEAMQEAPSESPHVDENFVEEIAQDNGEDSDELEMETKENNTAVDGIARDDIQHEQMFESKREDEMVEHVDEVVQHHGEADLPETQRDGHIDDTTAEGTTNETNVLEERAAIRDDEMVNNDIDSASDFSDWSSSRKPKNLDLEDGDESKDVENKASEEVDSLSEQEFASQAKGFLPELVLAWFDGASSLVILGTAVVGVLPISLLFCFCGGKMGPNVEALKKKFEEDLVSAMSERDKAQTELTASKKKTELLERSLREERESNVLLQEDKNRSQRDHAQWVSQQKKLEEEVRQLTSVNSQQVVDLQSEQAHSAYYQQQLAASVEQTTSLQQEVQQLQTDIETCTIREDQLKNEVEQMRGQIAQLEQMQNKLSQENNQWRQQCQSHEEQLSAAHKETATVQMSLTETEKEAEVLRDCLQQLNAIALADRDEDPTEDEETRKQKTEELQRQKFNDLVNARKAYSELKTAQQECKELQARLHVERDAHQQLQKKLDKLQSEYDAQREMYTTTESQFTQTNAKLQALSEYLKEREETLQTKLGKEEAARALIANKEQTASERAAAAEEDMARQRQQVNELRQQMAEIEKNLLQQLSINEKRAQEALAQLRICEQQLRESNQEVTVLSRRLADAESHIALSQRTHPPGPAFGPIPPSSRHFSPPPSQHGFNRPKSPHGPPGPPEKRRSMTGQRSPPSQRRDFNAPAPPMGSRDNPPRPGSRPSSRGPTYPPRPSSIGPPQETMLPRRDSKGLPHPDAMAPHRPEAIRPPRPNSMGPPHDPMGPSSVMPFHSLPPMSHGMLPLGRGPPMPGPRTSSPSGKQFDVPDGPLRYQHQPLRPVALGGLPPRPGMPNMPGMVPVRQPVPRQPMMHPMRMGQPLEKQHQMDGSHPGNSSMSNEV